MVVDAQGERHRQHQRGRDVAHLRMCMCMCMGMGMCGGGFLQLEPTIDSSVGRMIQPVQRDQRDTSHQRMPPCAPCLLLRVRVGVRVRVRVRVRLRVMHACQHDLKHAVGVMRMDGRMCRRVCSLCWRRA